MATYAELDALRTDSALLGRIRTACLVSCDTIRLEATGTTNHAQRLVWARQTMVDPETAAKDIIGGVLAQNRSAIPSAITGATDAAVQTAVDNAILLMLV